MQFQVRAGWLGDTPTFDGTRIQVRVTLLPRSTQGAVITGVRPKFSMQWLKRAANGSKPFPCLVNQICVVWRKNEKC